MVCLTQMGAGILLLLVICLHLKYALSGYMVTQMTEARKLRLYRGYQEVEMHHYTVANQVLLATWEFKANGTPSCASKEISVHLRYGSFPVINPDNSSFPNLFVLHKQFQYHIKLKADMISVFFNVSTPWPGDWFAAAFVDDDSQIIMQKGLYSPCEAWLLSSLKLNVEYSVINLAPNEKLTQQISKPQFYKYYADLNTWTANISISSCQISNVSSPMDCPLSVVACPMALPSITNPSSNCNFINCTGVEKCGLTTIPSEERLNYILVHPQNNEIVDFTVELNFAVCDHATLKNQPDNATLDSVLVPSMLLQQEGTTIFSTLNESTSPAEQYFNFEFIKAQEYPSCWPQVTLARDTEPSHFSFQYLIVEDEKYFPLLFNVSTSIPTMTKFQIWTLIDIGGTLIIELALPSLSDDEKNATSNVTVEVCLQFDVRPTLTQNGSCSSGMSLIANTSSWESRLSAILIPYPEIGTWYASIFPHCYIEGDNNSSSITVPCDIGYIGIILRIKSTPCILGQCGDYGNCHLYSSGGLIYSSCHCIVGWKGWGCTDGRDAFSTRQLLVSVLLLTLSNIFFIPVIVLAIYRHFYTEASVYFASMIFSTFYHACDADVYSFCLMRLSVLQFCDFYSAILSIWVTLIAMAKLSHTLQSLVHMLGAIGLALGVEYDRTGLLVFVVPAGTGLLILTISWVRRCYKQHTCHPRKRTWFLYLFPGVLLAASGLIMFAFFETKENYAYVHSAWHATMALSVLFLLPGRHDDKAKGETVISKFAKHLQNCKIRIIKGIRRWAIVQQINEINVEP